MNITDISKSGAKAVLKNRDTGALASFYALNKLVGSGWLLWEPESLWLELKHQHVDVPVEKRSQVMSARSLITTGRFYYDALVFEKTCVAFNGEEPNYDNLEDAPVEYIAWTVEEADTIQTTFDDDFVELDREPVKYTAVQLYRAGFVLAPDRLFWAQEELDLLHNKEAHKLRDKVMKEWAATPKSNLLDVAFPETATGTQLAKLASVQVYFNDKKDSTLKELATLKDPRPE